MKILVVDDNAESCRMQSTLLEKHGHQVLTAANGAEALDMVQEMGCDLIISDGLMPVMDGFQFCRELKEDERFRQIPFIFHTAVYTDEKDEKLAAKLGISRLIPKPMDPFTFVETVQKVMDDARNGRLPASPHLLDKEEDFKEFSCRLVEKLEGKMVELDREILQRQQVEETLKESERNYLEVFNATNEAILIYDAATVKIMAANLPAQEMFGYTVEELLGVEAGDLSCGESPYTKEVLIERFQQVKECGPQVFEWQARRKDGVYVWLEVSLKSSTIGGQGRVLAVARDIGERKKAEQDKERLERMLRQAQKMESIGTLAGGIAHDFNNILTPILGYAEILLMKVREDGPMQEGLQEILKASRRAKDLVSQILTFSRQSEHEMQPLLIQLVVKEALKLLRSSIPTSIEIRQNIKNDCRPVLADPTQIHQVVMNLCTNAYYAMREKGGILGVSLTEVEICPEDYHTQLQLHPGNYLLLEISDSGIGMPPEIQEKIFEPYFTTKEQGEGTGLGLAVVHGIIQSCSGQITVYSESGQGTTFHVYLPAAAGLEDRRRSEGGREASSTELPRGSERVMVVDDESAIVRLESRIIERLGYRVTSVNESPVALALFEKNPQEYDLVITDMAMPVMTGTELAHRMISIRPDIPIILCTGFSEMINEEKAKAMGIKAYVTKPVTNRRFAELIRKVLDERREEQAQ